MVEEAAIIDKTRSVLCGFRVLMLYIADMILHDDAYINKYNTFRDLRHLKYDLARRLTGTH